MQKEESPFKKQWDPIGTSNQIRETHKAVCGSCGLSAPRNCYGECLKCGSRYHTSHMAHHPIVMKFREKESMEEI